MVKRKRDAYFSFQKGDAEMNDTWVKLFRKIENKGWLKRDHNAFIVFSWLLIKVDRFSGKYSLGRNYCKEVGMKPSTFWMTLQRLVRCGAIDMVSNNKYSEVQIVKWGYYQNPQDRNNNPYNNKITTKQQPDDTKQEIRNKELRIKRESPLTYLLNIPLEDIQEFTTKFQCTDRQIKHKAEQLYDYCQSKGKEYQDYKAFLRKAISQDFGERVKIPVFKPDLPELSEEQRLKNIAMIQEMKKKIFKTIN